MDYEVSVGLKPDVLDPEARAICDSLSRLGYKTIKNIKIKKLYILETLEEEDASDEVSDVAAKHLTNSVSEIFEVIKR